MGAANCQHCGQLVDVIDPGKPWSCPTCGRVAGPAVVSPLEQAGKGALAVVFVMLAGFCLLVLWAAIAG